ncbi:hypothetical protein D915_010620 [Fasciola hepatica]|uniref:BPTI/Kunitz inhibitor domain-containing protein n=1 Tax=Fasciola hepatica TaxID=6192 RepID=A0A4E0R923_FASHE|nr:hypothetical protein D915_010620 [Fasciola hepatica]
MQHSICFMFVLILCLTLTHARNSFLIQALDPHFPCYLPKNRGLGSERLKRWYYDYKSGECKQFLYRGANGNGNNFYRKIECDATCVET